MSDHNDLHGAPETSHSNLALSIAGALGTMLLFALIVFLAYYLPAQDKTPVNDEKAQEYKATLTELQSQEADLATSYGVVSADDGLVRIPIERAKELIVPRLNQESSK